MRERPFLPRRRSVRLTQFDYSNSARYFLTICAQDRRPVFGKVNSASVELSALGCIVNKRWIEIPHHFPQVELGPHVVMPDHVHGILIIRPPTTASPTRAADSAGSLDGRIPTKDEGRARYIVPLRREDNVREFGASVAGSVATIVATFKAAVSRKATRQRIRTQAPLWQRGYYEHIIRDEQVFANACAYIRSNPVRRSSARGFPRNQSTADTDL